MALKSADDVATLRQGIAVLRLFNGHDSLTCREVADALGVTRAAAHRLVNTLRGLGYLDVVTAGRGFRYFLTPRVHELSDGVEGEMRLVEAARPLMLRWTEQHQLPLALVTPAGDEFFVRFTTDHYTSSVLHRFRPGFYGPVFTAAAGLVCLAAQPAEIRRAIIRNAAARPSPEYDLARQPDVLERQLEQVQRHGYATYVPSNERENSIAVPILRRGHFVGAVTMRYMRAARSDSRTFTTRLQWLRTLASDIEARLGDAPRPATGTLA